MRSNEISFDGVNLDAETVRAKLAEHDAVVTVIGRRMETGNGAKARVTEKYNSTSVRISFKSNNENGFVWTLRGLDQLAEFVTQLAADIRQHGVQ